MFTTLTHLLLNDIKVDNKSKIERKDNMPEVVSRLYEFADSAKEKAKVHKQKILGGVAVGACVAALLKFNDVGESQLCSQAPEHAYDVIDEFRVDPSKEYSTAKNMPELKRLFEDLNVTLPGVREYEDQPSSLSPGDLAKDLANVNLRDYDIDVRLAKGNEEIKDFTVQPLHGGEFASSEEAKRMIDNKNRIVYVFNTMPKELVGKLDIKEVVLVDSIKDKNGSEQFVVLEDERIEISLGYNVPDKFETFKKFFYQIGTRIDQKTCGSNNTKFDGAMIDLFRVDQYAVEQKKAEAYSSLLNPHAKNNLRGYNEATNREMLARLAMLDEGVGKFYAYRLLSSSGVQDNPWAI